MTSRELMDKIHEITDQLERQAGIELQKSMSYHAGYIKACEDFGRAMRMTIIEDQEED